MSLKELTQGLNRNLGTVALLFIIAPVTGGCDKTEAILLIEKPTDVQDGSKTPYPPGYPSRDREPEKIIATLKPGDRVPVKGMYHGKDYDAFEVELPNGTKGFVIPDNTFKVLPPKGNRSP
jgi:hypothetical protein